MGEGQILRALKIVFFINSVKEAREPDNLVTLPKI